jgi:hypothetical protein
VGEDIRKASAWALALCRTREKERRERYRPTGPTLEIKIHSNFDLIKKGVLPHTRERRERHRPAGPTLEIQMN